MPRLKPIVAEKGAGATFTIGEGANDAVDGAEDELGKRYHMRALFESGVDIRDRILVLGPGGWIVKPDPIETGSVARSALDDKFH